MEGETTQLKNPNEPMTLIVNVDQQPSVPEKDAIAIPQHIDPVMIDLENLMSIVYNVIKACIKEQTDNVYYYMDFMVNRMVYLTNLERHILSEIVHKTKEPIRTDMLEETMFETPEADFLIRQTLIKLYTKNNKIPKMDSLMHITKELRYKYQLHEQLKRSGYVWRRLPNTNKAIIMEHPKRVIQRERYLKQVMSYRKESRCLVYIEAKILSKVDKYFCHFQDYLTEGVNFIIVFIAVSNKEDFLNGHILVSKSIYKCQKLIEDHIIKNVIPCLSEPSVLILEDKHYYKKSLPIPTIESQKSEMVEWLKINGIPHEENVHRCELFELIQRCRGKSDLHNFDTVVYAHGHEILRRPPRTDYLNYYKPMWMKLYFTGDMVVSISQKSRVFWKHLEKSIEHAEKTVHVEDVAMESVTDKILTMANNVDVKMWANIECEEEEDSLDQEELINEIKNTFLPDELKVRERQFLFEIKKFERVLNKAKK